MKFSTDLFFYTYRSNKKCLARDETKTGTILGATSVANICKIDFHRTVVKITLKCLVFACYIDVTV